MTTHNHPWDQPTDRVLPPVDTGWTPTYAHGLQSDRPLNETPAPLDSTWIVAPTGSHISRFKYLDARANSLLRKFGRVLEDGGSQNPFARGASELHVIFKDERNGGESPEYAYFFNDHAKGQQIFEQMQGSPHPHGQVLYPLVVRGGIPYQRVSRAAPEAGPAGGQSGEH